AESFAYLLRKIENYQSFIDYLFDRKQQCDENELESLALVFSETCQNVQSTFHSCTKSLLTCLWKKFLEKPKQLQSCITTIYSLLIQHATKQNVDILWSCFMNIYRSINHNESTIVYQTFYDIFQLFIEHKMLIDMDLCCEFLTIVKTYNNNDFFVCHKWICFFLIEQVFL
ncbi:unnamed protein product, partial [Adineta steineri]